MADTWQLQRYIVVCMGTCGLILGWLWNKKRNRNETKRNETQQKLNETTINETIFLHQTTIHKMLVADWKTFKIFGEFGKILCSHLPSNVPSILFRFSECLDPLLEKKKISPFPYAVLPPEICNMIFFKSWIPQIYQTVEMDEDEEGAYIFMLQNWGRTSTTPIICVWYTKL